LKGHTKVSPETYSLNIGTGCLDATGKPKRRCARPQGPHEISALGNGRAMGKKYSAASDAFQRVKEHIRNIEPIVKVKMAFQERAKDVFQVFGHTTSPNDVMKADIGRRQNATTACIVLVASGLCASGTTRIDCPHQCKSAGLGFGVASR
jgi:hypothetical protein